MDSKQLPFKEKRNPKTEYADSKVILGKLMEKFHAPDWFAIPELRGGTGYSIDRTIDFYAISKWAKHGYGIGIAFEIKVSRGDFKNEIIDPKKRDYFVRNSHQFYYVTPPGLIAPGETPKECGLVEIGRKYRIIKVAEQRSDTKYSPAFVASIINRLYQTDEFKKTLEKKEDPSNMKLFKWVGKDITRADLEKIIIENERGIKARLEKEAYDKHKKEFKENIDNEYNKLVKGICEILGEKVPDGYAWGRNPPIHNVESIIGSVQYMSDELKAKKDNVTNHDLRNIRADAESIKKIVDEFITQEKK